LSVSAEELLIDKSQLLKLTAPELTVFVRGRRALGANFGGSKNGVFTSSLGELTNDFFLNLLDMKTPWKAIGKGKEVHLGSDRATGEPKRTAPRADLEFDSNSEL
jgi:catalase-peroxidase